MLSAHGFVVDASHTPLAIFPKTCYTIKKFAKRIYGGNAK